VKARPVAGQIDLEYIKQHSSEEVAGWVEEVATPEVLEGIQWLAVKKPYLLFVPHEKQLEFFRCTKRSKWIFGGNRSGKTTAAIIELAMLMQDDHPFIRTGGPGTYFLGVDRKDHIADPFVGENWRGGLVRRWFGESVVDIQIGGASFVTSSGSVCRFRTYQAGRRAWESVSLQGVYFDEEPPEDVFQEAMLRVGDQEGRIWGAMTPMLNGMTYMFQRVYKNELNDPEVWSIVIPTADNPGFGEEERERLKNSLGNEAQVAVRLHGLFVPLGGASVFGADDVTWYHEQARAPMWKGELQRKYGERECVMKEGEGRLKVWERPVEGKEYVVAVDPSAPGDDGDPTAMQVLRRDTGDFVATWWGKGRNYLELAFQVATLGYWYNTALVGIEVTGGGEVLLQEVTRGLSGAGDRMYPSLYQRQAAPDRMTGRRTGKLGWATTVSTRPLLVETLRRFIKDRAVGIYDAAMVEEMTTFIYMEKSASRRWWKAEAQRGCHDDRLMAAAIALVIHEGLVFRVDPAEDVRRQQHTAAWAARALIDQQHRTRRALRRGRYLR